MKESEIGKLLALVQEIWPQFSNGRHLKDTAVIWQRIFANDTFSDAEIAVLAYASNDEKGFPPPIGALKAYIHKMHDDSPNEQEAWQVVRKAIGNSSYHSAEEYDRLPDAMKRCVAGPQFLRDCADMDVDQIDTVVASQFMKTYRAEKAKMAEVQKMPAEIQRLFERKPSHANLSEPIMAKLPPKKEETAESGVPCPDAIKAKLRMLLGEGEK